MSDHDPSAAPSTPTEEKPVDGKPSPAPRARWVDGVSGALLLASGIVAVSAAAPALLRAAGAPLPQAGGAGTAPTIDLRHQPPEILSDPDRLLDPDHDVDPDDAPFVLPRSSGQGGQGQLGLARGATLLRNGPTDGGKPVGEIKAGELVMILKESGDWLQVWASGNDSVAMGWVKKSGIAVR